ncbi:MAG: SAM-dependent DNA methyltransferase, partial [Proteobacteria bacterium]
ATTTKTALRDRSNEILFIDARKLGVMINRRNKELTDADLQKITDTYHSWRSVIATNSSLRGTKQSPATAESLVPYQDVAGFCKASTLDEVRANNYVLMPGRYVGTEAEEDDGILFSDKILALTTKLAEQFSRGHVLEAEIRENLKGIGYEL